MCSDESFSQTTDDSDSFEIEKQDVEERNVLLKIVELSLNWGLLVLFVALEIARQCWLKD